ncbi:hypothetical protein H6G80_30255 [Nostoc sp. FACHB-87]|uniref:hypothetical protein n=1 Tax=Nostocaceae TaxID=1162 RepID=UPI0016832833|nr:MULTISPECIES: hypothetical protein [Nostocaceae]MBD2458337.1 hypothetical protein [Nostoc sp. FACHB-87]MBD2479352.1 hypothetical protein [Anabaena sp. FACHB-83]
MPQESSVVATVNGAGTSSNIIPQGWAVDNALKFRRPISVDNYAETALKATAEWITIKKWEEYKKDFQEKAKDPSNEIAKIGIGTNARDTLPKRLPIEKIDELTKKLDTSGLEDIPRLLLSNSDIYAFTLLQAVDGVRSDDTTGLTNAVLLRITDEPRRYFLAMLLAEVTNDLKIRITTEEKDPNKNWPRLVELTLQRGIDIRVEQVRPAVMGLLSILYREGNIPYYLDRYISTRSSAIPATSFTPIIKQSIIDYLIKLGVVFNAANTEENFQKGAYDEYFLLAYNEAVKKSAIADDPIDTARIKGGEVTWNFTVDSFDSFENQGVIPANIKAAGVLDYIYNIGERMRVFDVANALVLRWASGMLDIPGGKTAAALYRFHKLRNERNTPAERAMLYKRVLNKGNGKLLSNMVVNEAFPTLWHQLMAEVAEYIRKSERSKDVWVSKSPLFQATKNLQYNLTEHMTGMSHVQVTEDYAHLQEALDILRSEEIINSFGGRRKSLWSVIEQVAKEDLNTMVATATLRTIAVEGNKIFQWVAGFETEGAVREADFETLLSAAESWIIAQASMETGTNGKFLPQGSASYHKTSTKHRSLPRSRDTVKPKEKGGNSDFDDWDV